MDKIPGFITPEDQITLRVGGEDAINNIRKFVDKIPSAQDNLGWIDDIVKKVDFNPKTLQDKILVWYGEIMNPVNGVGYLSGKGKEKIDNELRIDGASLVSQAEIEARFRNLKHS